MLWWGRSWSLSSARTLTHCGKLQLPERPPSPLPHCRDTCPLAGSASAPATPSLAKGYAPASQEVLSKKKRKNKSIPFGEIAGVSRRGKECFLPGLKTKDAGYKPCSCQSELESTWVRERVSTKTGTGIREVWWLYPGGCKE